MQNFSKRGVTSITAGEIQDIRQLLFNQAPNKFLPSSWSQGFMLNESENCFYGLYQKEGGPCGVIACVQAYFLKYLFFVYPQSIGKTKVDIEEQKSKLIRENCLVAALAEILFNVRGGDSIIRLAVVNSTTGG